MLDNLKRLFTDFSWENPIVVALIKLVILTIVVVVGYKVILLLVKSAIKLRKKHEKNAESKIETIYQIIRSFLKYAVVFVYICLVLPIFGVNPSAILAGAGLIGLVVGFAFQDLLNDVVSGFSIVFNNTFDVGDFVDINGNVGNVVNMGIKTTVIRSFTGELCTLNNRLIVNVRNYTKADNALVINYFRLLPTVDLQKVYEIFDQEMDEILVKYQEDIIEKPKIVGTNAIGDRSIEFQVNTVVKPGKQWQFRRSLGDELVLMCQRHKLPIPGVSYIIENK